tara:strand:- start:2322 stop:2879 length:558 start_codon:yes stop_codon:yes gene_type:complete
MAMKEPTVSDMSIADEHIVVDAKSKVGDVCGKLSINPRNAVLVMKKGEITGVITAKDIFAHLFQGKHVAKLKVEKIMKSNILTFNEDEKLSVALDVMSKERPDAMVIVDSDNSFIGYFSAEDYRDATRRLEAHQLMAARLSRSKKAINKQASKESRPTELLDLLLGGNDFEDEEDETPPSTFTLG